MKFARKFAAVLMLVVLATPLFATPTALTPNAFKQNNYPVVAGDLTLASVAMDATNGNSFIWTGREVLVFLNTDASAHTITINSVADPFGRLDTSLTTYSIPAVASGKSGVAVIEFSQGQGWIGSGNVVTMTTSSALIYVGVERYQ